MHNCIYTWRTLLRGLNNSLEEKIRGDNSSVPECSCKGYKAADISVGKDFT